MSIVTHLWYDTQAVAAANLYTSIFPDSRVDTVSTIKDTPSGDCDLISFTLAGQPFQAISAGPYFKFNPSISLFAIFTSAADIDAAWEKLVAGGTVLMEYAAYPWAHKYGWLQDKYGLSWQLSWSDEHKFAQQITPLLTFTQDVAGKAQEAMAAYTSIFPHSKIDLVVPYTKDDADREGFVKHARFTLNGQHFMAMESFLDHKFKFNEAVSFIVNCADQAEIDYYWQHLSAVPAAERCGWLKDKYGVSWQIVPTDMAEMMSHGAPDQIARVTQAFLTMKKFDLAALRKAYQG